PGRDPAAFQAARRAADRREQGPRPGRRGHAPGDGDQEGPPHPPDPDPKHVDRCSAEQAADVPAGRPIETREVRNGGVMHAPMATPQAPIASDCNALSTAADVIRGHELRGKTAVVTGGSAGIGLETTRALSSAGARVVVPARDIEKARAAVGT